MISFRLFSLLILLRFMVPCLGQTTNSKNEYSHLMQERQKFSLGSPERIKAKEYHILMDELNYCLYQFSDRDIEIREPLYDSIHDYLGLLSNYLTTDGLGSAYSLKRKLIGKRNPTNVIAHGDVSSNHELNLQKINSLIFPLDYGRSLNLANYERLKKLSLQPWGLGIDAIRERVDPFIRIGAEFYKGDPYFMDEVLELKELETLHINQSFTSAPSYEASSADLTCLDIPMSKIISMPNLENFSCSGEVLLPVNFRDFEKFELLIFAGCYAPELANLALVMYHYGKDTSLGNWKNYLDLVDLEKQFIIPMDGVYKSYYKNGQLLCYGNYENGKPNGEWNFWYDDGSLCQKRIYAQGNKVGKWLILNSELYSYQSIPDTLMERHYENDRLVYLISHEKDVVYQCDNYEFTYESNIKTEYWISRDVENNVDIKKRALSIRIGEYWETMDTLVGVGDTLTQLDENYRFTPSDWSYTKTWKCLSYSRQHHKLNIETQNLKGIIGKMPSYIASTSSSRHSNVFGSSYSKMECILDFDRKTYSERGYENNGKTDELKLTYETIKDF